MQKRGLYGKIGKKIKGLAIAFFVIGVLASVAIGIYYLAAPVKILLGTEASNLAATLISSAVIKPLAIGLVFPIVGSLIFLFVSWFIYGYGELVDRNTRSNLR